MTIFLRQICYEMYHRKGACLFAVPRLEYLVAHYSDVMMRAMASQITGVTIVYSTVCLGADMKTAKLRVTGLCEGNSLVTGDFPA